MLPKFLKKLLFGLVLAALLLVGLPILVAETGARAHLYTPDVVPDARVAIVFCAGLQRDGTPSAVLRDRVEMATQLYFDGKVNKLLMSGDNRFVEYNEPGSMRDYAVRLGVPEKDIVLDYAGRRTYDTCYRAIHIFGVREAVLVTQRFHLTRALFTCNNLGVQSNGVAADNRYYRKSSRAFWQVRETFATAVAFWEVWIIRPLPVLGTPEPIDLEASTARRGFTHKDGEELP
jgi:SanA protein